MEQALIGNGGYAKEVIELLLTRSLLEKRMSTYYKGLVNLIEEQNWKRNMIYGQLNQELKKQKVQV